MLSETAEHGFVAMSEIVLVRRCSMVCRSIDMSAFIEKSGLGNKGKEWESTANGVVQILKIAIGSGESGRSSGTWVRGGAVR